MLIEGDVDHVKFSLVFNVFDNVQHQLVQACERKSPDGGSMKHCAQYYTEQDRSWWKIAVHKDGEFRSSFLRC